MTQQIVKLGHAARAKARIKVRQPLSTVELALPPGALTAADLADQLEVIKEELNVKEISFLESVEGKAKVVVKPNGKLLGPKLGAAVQDVIREAKAGNYEQLPSGNYRVLDYELTPEEIEIAYESLDDKEGGVVVEADQGIVVLLCTEITPELQREGYARDLVRCIQNLRKEADFNVADHIKVGITCDDEDIQASLTEFREYIQTETLAIEISSEKRPGDWESVIELGKHGVVVSIERG